MTKHYQCSVTTKEGVRQQITVRANSLKQAVREFSALVKFQYSQFAVEQTA